MVMLGWIMMPLNRPRPGALALQIAMVWALVTAAAIARLHLHGGAMRYQEWIALSMSAATFAVGIYVSRYTRWGRKRFARPWSRRQNAPGG
jgi:hypothetical protein